MKIETSALWDQLVKLSGRMMGKSQEADEKLHEILDALVEGEEAIRQDAMGGLAEEASHAAGYLAALADVGDLLEFMESHGSADTPHFGQWPVPAACIEIRSEERSPQFVAETHGVTAEIVLEIWSLSDRRFQGLLDAHLTNIEALEREEA